MSKCFALPDQAPTDEQTHTSRKGALYGKGGQNAIGNHPFLSRVQS